LISRLIERDVAQAVNRPRDRDRHFVILNPPGQKLAFLEFMQYQPGSVYRENEGKSLGARRISTHLEHAGIVTTDLPAARAFYEKMGFKETWSRNTDDGKPLLIHYRMPGPSGDYVELSVRPPDAKLTRAQAGSAGHFSLEVPEIQAALNLGSDFTRGKQADPGGSQLNPKRHPLYQLAYADDRFPVLFFELETDIRPAGALQEELDRAERLHLLFCNALGIRHAGDF
jgi:catechol 2,3-dioxygenase-like lactoylglutathione lyase family enzyme